MLGFLDAVRTLILYRNQLMDEYKATAYTDYNIQIYTVNALIGTLKFKVADFMFYIPIFLQGSQSSNSLLK